MKVLVTGAAGYIGSVLVRKLLTTGHTVRGFDILLFGGESLISVYNHPQFEFIRGDIREKNEVRKALYDIDCVIHLAAIVGDPACAKQPTLANETNWVASKMIFDLSHEMKNVKRFVFASTCSNYGKMGNDGYVDEDSPLKPISLYAELKVKFEKYLLNSKTRSDFIPTSLRFATAYGISPRMRFDLTVNEFIREVTCGNELKIYGEQFWRPYTHVEDLARACLIVSEARAKKVDRCVFGVGDTKENYQKKSIADEIYQLSPDAKIKYVHKDEDPRDYKVEFTKIKKELGFNITKTVPQGLKEVYDVLRKGIISNPFANRYRNI